MNQRKTEQFIRIWNAVASPDEVAERTGLSKVQVTRKASHLRRRGVELKHFTKSKLDYKVLAKIAKDSLT